MTAAIPDAPADVHAALDTHISGVRDEIARTDTKAGIGLGVVSVLAGALVYLAGQHPHRAAFVLAVVSAAATAAATTLGLLVTMPRLRGRTGWVLWSEADTTPEAVLGSLGADEQVRHLQVLSRICRRKMRLYQATAATTWIAVITLAAAAFSAS